MIDVHSTVEPFAEDGVLRRVFSERLVAFSGLRALLMQGAHPLGVAGFLERTTGLEDPFKRLERTDAAMNRIYLGDAETVASTAATIRAMHRRVRGTISEDAGIYPAGTPYAADDPELLLWVLATLADSAVLYYRVLVGRLSDRDAERFWQEYRRVGMLLGLADEQMPPTARLLRRYMNEMLASDRLHVLPRARELAIEIVWHPPLPFFLWPGAEAMRQLTVGLLPARIRRLYDFRWDPARKLLLATGAESAKRLLLPILPRPIRRVPAAAPAG